MQKAIADANLGWNDIDLIIDCSTSQYRPIPCNAVHYQHAIGEVALGIPCFDIHSSCLGSLVAMNMLNGMFGLGTCRNVMLVAAETGLSGVNYQEPESACLIGDGAAALVLSRKQVMQLWALASRLLLNISICAASKVAGTSYRCLHTNKI